MTPGNEENVEDAWNNEWDDNESTTEGQHETQQILHDPDEEEMEDEIQANLKSKITSSLHNYKVAGVALIIALISFTINTVRISSAEKLIAGICAICSRDFRLAKAILHAVPDPSLAS